MKKDVNLFISIVTVTLVALFIVSTFSSASTTTSTSTTSSSTTTSSIETTTSTSTSTSTSTTTTTIAPSIVLDISETSHISIVQTIDSQQGPCLPALLSLQQLVSSSDTSFTLTVLVPTPLCEPVRATAVVYSMPGNGTAWPQTLLEASPFILSEAGSTTITFHKDAQCLQFDVITGYAPQTISPLGPWHGPLLFPFDLSTSQQYWGCPVVPVPVEIAPSQSVTKLDFTG